MKALLLVCVALCACGRSASPAVAPRGAEREIERESTPVARLTPDVALQRIEAHYVGGMQRCYRARLKRDPSARGKVVVTFTVDDRGKLAYRDARGVARSVERCVEAAMLRWSFPAPAQEMSFRLAFRLSSRT